MLLTFFSNLNVGVGEADNVNSVAYEHADAVKITSITPKKPAV